MADDEKEAVVELIVDEAPTSVTDDFTPTPAVPPMLHVEAVAALSNIAMALIAAGNGIAEDAHSIGQGYMPYDPEFVKLRLKQLRARLRELGELLT